MLFTYTIQDVTGKRYTFFNEENKLFFRKSSAKPKVEVTNLFMNRRTNSLTVWYKENSAIEKSSVSFIVGIKLSNIWKVRLLCDFLSELNKEKLQ